MRTRFSSHSATRDSRSVLAIAPSDFALDSRAQARAPWQTARRLTLALAASAPLCAGALWAGPAQAAPTVESDENGPLVQIIKPGYNDVLKGNYRILIQVTARKYNPQSVEMFIDDVSATKGPMAISSFASSSYDFDTRLMSDGRHKLTVRVTDSQGFRGWSEVTVFVNNKGVVDTQVPDLRWIGVKPFQEFSGDLSLGVNASDNFGVKLLQISLSPSDSPNNPVASVMMNQPPYRIKVDTIGRKLPDGLYVVNAKAFDSLDQQGDAPQITIGIVNDQINATRVQDMLEGRRQMQRVLAGQKPDDVAPQSQTVKIPVPDVTAKQEVPPKVNAVEVPATTATSKEPATVVPQTVVPQTVVPQTVVPQKVVEVPATGLPAENVNNAASGHSSVPTKQDRVLPPAPAQGAQSAYGKGGPALLPPTFKVPAQTVTNPGIQVPPVNTPGAAMPSGTAPRVVPQIATPKAVVPNVVEPRVGETHSTPTEVSPSATPSAESAPTVPNIESAPNVTAPTKPTETKTAEATTTKATTTETKTIEPTRLAEVPSRRIGDRNAGEASLSRAAVELALSPATDAPIQVARGSQPIAVARFSQPDGAGRDVAGVAVLSSNAGRDQSRLSNAELSRVRSNTTRVLSAIRPIAAPKTQLAQPARAGTLQISAPSLEPRQVLSRAITADSIKAPAPKLTREALTREALTPPLETKPAETAKPAFSGALSKTVLASQRLAPIAPETGAKSAATAATRGVIAKAAPSSERAKPIELAPAFMAKNRATSAQASHQAPQMSALSTPRMSESASGVGVPSRISGAAPLPKTPVASAKTLDGERVAALPRPDAARRNRDGAAIVAVPLDAPLEIADATATPIPASYRAERTTTLRAIAARFGLPVEMVALSNNWTSDMKVLSGMEVKLPRPLQVSYNGVPVTGDAPSMLMGDTAVTAFRFMFEKTGGKMEWDAKNQRVIARKDGREITLTIGSNVAKVGEREVMMEIAAFLFQGRTMVPLRFFEEGLNAQVEWNPQTGRLVVAMAG